MTTYQALVARYASDVYPEPNTGCWIWVGCTSRVGYGMIAVPKESGQPFGTGAHRVFYQALRGIIPRGMVIDHLCKVKACVNPDHMEVVTLAENTRRAQSGSKHPKPTHCKRGHRYTAETTIVHKSDGRWECKTCTHPRKMEWQRKRRAGNHSHSEEIAP